MSKTTRITVHSCESCGDHARETDGMDGSLMGGRQGWEVDGFMVAPCERCKQMVCESCQTDCFCCDGLRERREHAERQNEQKFRLRNQQHEMVI